MLVWVCGHCKAEHVGMQLRGEYQIRSDTWAVFLECGACNAPSSAILRDERYVRGERPRNPSASDRDILADSWRIISIHPTPKYPDIPDHLPTEVRNYMQQAAGTHATGKAPDATIMLCRSALETALKVVEKEETDKPSSDSLPLAARIRRLTDKGLLAPALAEWADHVRGLGRDSAHGVGEGPFGARPEGQEIAEEAYEFTSLVLEYLFTMPERVRIARERAKNSGTGNSEE